MKAIILLMSCNNPLYEKEEQACRETFLKDADEEGITYFFYKGLDEAHSAQCIDNQTHTIYLDVNDTLQGTAEKTIMAMETISGLQYDYLIKTNVSTYLNIRNIMEAVNGWDGENDLNIYGARFIINRLSKNIPFPRGFFTIMSKTLVSGALHYARTLLAPEKLPKTDDTLISLCVLYYLKKNLETDYLNKLMEIPAIISWDDDIVERTGFRDAMAIRCKNEKDKEKTPENILKVHNLLKNNALPIRHFLPAINFETLFGVTSFENFIKLNKVMEKVKGLANASKEKTRD